MQLCLYDKRYAAKRIRSQKNIDVGGSRQEICSVFHDSHQVSSASYM